jgi:DNA polymerase III delta prime subunit
VRDGDCPHLLFYGASGAGKKTLVLALLKEIFGPGAERVKVEQKEWKVEVGERKVEVELVTLSSNYHVEMNPSDVGNKDKLVVQEVIREMARGRLLGVEGGKGYKGALLAAAQAQSSTCAPRICAGAPLLFADSRSCAPLPSSGAERGGQALARGAARAATNDGAVLMCASMPFTLRALSPAPQQPAD